MGSKSRGMVEIDFKALNLAIKTRRLNKAKVSAEVGRSRNFISQCERLGRMHTSDLSAVLHHLAEISPLTEDEMDAIKNIKPKVTPHEELTKDVTTEDIVKALLLMTEELTAVKIALSKLIKERG